MTPRLTQRLAVASFLGGILVFYLWTASSSGNPFQFSRQATGLYNLLTDAFLAGRLSLVVEPKPELLALPDPYDPALNERFRLHDASLYKGKYYLSWGLAPALTLFVPFRLTFDRYLDENLAVALFGFGGLVWAVLLLELLTRTYVPRTPFWMQVLAVLCLGISNVVPYLLRRPLVYEVAIASGYCFLFGGLYWCVAGTLGPPTGRLWRLALGSLFLGLAVGSRPHLLLAGLVPAVLWTTFLRERGRPRVRETTQTLVCLFGPWLICVALLGLYNYARFESWTEFGQRYALGSLNLLKWKKLDPRRIPIDLYFYFLSPSRLDWNFPFFHLAPRIPSMLVPHGYYGPEPVAGLLTNIPFLNVLYLLPLLFNNSTGRMASLGLVLATFIVTALTLATVIIAHSATMRYVAEFVSLLLLPAVLLWFALDERWNRLRRTRLLVRTLVIASILYGSLFNLAISITGAEDRMKKHNPATYRAIERVFYPQFLTRYLATGFGPVSLKVRFSNPKPGVSEPLVVAGRARAGDCALVRYLGDDRIALGFAHGRRGGPLSAPIQIRPEAIYDIEVHMGSLYPSSVSLFSTLFPEASYDDARNLLLFKVNGIEVLRATSRFHYSAPSDVTIGKNRIGGGSCAERFSGEILAARRLHVDQGAHYLFRSDPSARAR